VFYSGTSFSSPITAGATILLAFKNLEINFNQTILKQMIIDLSLKDIIEDLEVLNTPNRLINIG
ncbi:hypothetical protein H8356DRAFT_945033, partial [Neocallimastix lanati (nom. inval.)]